MSPIKIGVLISGGGTNLQSIIDAVEAGEINGEVKVVISNREKAYGLERAKKHDIDAVYVNRKECVNDKDFNKEILHTMKKYDIDLIVLAGYLKILDPIIIGEYHNRIINIHPSLIPNFCGKGFYGSKVHQAVLDYGVKVTGATVHFVDEGTDTGPIILQETVKVEDNDTVESLQKKVLRVEHKILVEAVKLYCEGKLEVKGKKVHIEEGLSVKRALISVFDKTGVVEFAKRLVDMGWEIISTGGTAKKLEEAGVEVIDVSQITEFPECFDGRVKTLHPKIHGGLLAIRDNNEHAEKMKELSIQPIDIVVNNLYPFKETILREGVTHEEIIENIDIGGPSMLRAAAKNYKYVTVVVDPSDYNMVIDELESEGTVSNNTREYLAAKVFQHTSHYDALISSYFNKKANIEMPDTITLTFEKKQELRYGENPHQKAAYYTNIQEVEGTLSEAKQLNGKELSFNNINDTNGALEILKEFDEPTVVAVKHTNPCGIGSGKTIEEAFIKAYEGDKLSIFGGIIAANCEIDENTAKGITDIFIEVVVAPSYTKEALEILRSKKNMRVLELPNIKKKEYKEHDLKRVLGGVLLQDRNNSLIGDELVTVTTRKPTEKEMEDLLFAWKAVKNTKSNGIVLAKDKGTIAIGPGQVSRIWALENAVKQAGDNTKGSVMASDAFFPFSDCVEAAAKAGITAIIQPGGSVRDQESIDKANELGIAMIFTGMRHFKH